MKYCVADITGLLTDAAGDAAVLVAHERSIGPGSCDPCGLGIR